MPARSFTEPIEKEPSPPERAPGLAGGGSSESVRTRASPSCCDVTPTCSKSTHTRRRATWSGMAGAVARNERGFDVRAAAMPQQPHPTCGATGQRALPLARARAPCARVRPARACALPFSGVRTCADVVCRLAHTSGA
eukprot:2074246-Prymnesium_polylepis.1